MGCRAFLWQADVVVCDVRTVVEFGEVSMIARGWVWGGHGIEMKSVRVAHTLYPPTVRYSHTPYPLVTPPWPGAQRGWTGAIHALNRSETCDTLAETRAITGFQGSRLRHVIDTLLKSLMFFC